MLRLWKPVRLLEWGEGTNTTNQVWTVSGEGKITRSQAKNGVTTLVIELDAPFNKKNPKDNELKIAQPGEGMTSNSSQWGEVGVALLKSVEQGGKTVQVEIPTAIKIDTRHHG